jgi:hypothetical protein
VNLFNATHQYYLNNRLVLAAPTATLHGRAQQKKLIGNDNFESFNLAIAVDTATVTCRHVTPRAVAACALDSQFDSLKSLSHSLSRRRELHAPCSSFGCDR